MNTTVALLTARSLLGRRRALLLLTLPVLMVALSVLVRNVVGTDQALSASLLGGFGIGTMVPLLGLIVGTGAIGPEIDDGSIVYLLTKPISRHSIATTKLLVAAGLVSAVAAGPTLLAGLVLSGTADRVAVAHAVGALVAGVAYCAVFLLLAVVSRNAVIAGLLYALIWESLIGSFVPGAQALSVQQWSLAVTETVMGSHAASLGVASAVELPTGIVLLAVAAVGGTWLAGTRLRTLRLTGEA